MREILFRGKRIDNGEWVEGFLLRYNGAHCIQLEDIGCDDYGLYLRCYAEVIPETVGQYTGLDANGTKVFEGDILAFTDIEGRQQIEGAVVFGTFNCSCCDGVYGWEISGGDIRHLQDDNSFIKLFVIGNIHDNPELMKGGE